MFGGVGRAFGRQLGGHGNSITLPINHAPTVANPIPDQSATSGTSFSFTFASNAFNDVDVGDVLTYAATKSDGSALPAWLSFNALTRTFSGTPTSGDVGTVSVNVIATDTGGLSVTDTFNIVVSSAGGHADSLAWSTDHLVWGGTDRLTWA